MLPVEECVSQFMSQSRYTLGGCTIRIDADIFAVQQDGIVTQKVVTKTNVLYDMLNPMHQEMVRESIDCYLLKERKVAI